MNNDPMHLTNQHVNRIMQGPESSGLIREFLKGVVLMVLFVGVVWIAYGFGAGD